MGKVTSISALFLHNRVRSLAGLPSGVSRFGVSHLFTRSLRAPWTDRQTDRRKSGLSSATYNNG